VGRLFDEAERQAIPFLVLDGTTAEPVFDHPGGLEAAQMISSALRDGYIVVIPERPVLMDGIPRLGWWLIDPATGAAKDVLDTGGGATLAEWAKAVWNAWRAMPVFQRLAICLVIGFDIAQAVLLAQEAGGPVAREFAATWGGPVGGVPLGMACGL
jgi:hypothetical protein